MRKLAQRKANVSVLSGEFHATDKLERQRFAKSGLHRALYGIRLIASILRIGSRRT